MSTNVNMFNVPNPLQGSPQAQTDAVFRPTEEREAKPVGTAEAHQPIPVPVKLQEGYEPSSLTSILGHEINEKPVNVDVGFGPRIVILDHYVAGPRVVKDGEDRPIFERGQVIWLSALLGDELTQKALEGDVSALAQVRRYTIPREGKKNAAVRQATKDEQDFQRVTFLEGEQALGAALQTEQVVRTAIQDENERLRKNLTSLNIDPNASPEEIEAKLGALKTAEPAAPVLPQSDPEPRVQTPTQPPAMPTAPPVPSAAPPTPPPVQAQQPQQVQRTSPQPVAPPLPPMPPVPGSGGTGGGGQNNT